MVAVESQHKKCARPVVAVQEKDLQHGIIELDGLKSPAEPHDMPCVHKACRPRVGLACIDRHEAHVDHAREKAFSGDKRKRKDNRVVAESWFKWQRTFSGDKTKPHAFIVGARDDVVGRWDGSVD